MWPDIWRLHLTTLDLTLITHDVRTKSGPTTPWRHTMSERSQARRHPDDTRCQDEVNMFLMARRHLTTHDVRTKSGPTTPWRHTMSERSQARRHPDDTRCQNEVRRKSDDVRPSLRAGCPFNTNLGDCTSSHSFLSTHAHVFADARERVPFFPFLPYLFSIQTRPNVWNRVLGPKNTWAP